MGNTTDPFTLIGVKKGTEPRTSIHNLTLSSLDQDGPLSETHARSLFARYFTADPKSPWEYAGYTSESPAGA